MASIICVNSFPARPTNGNPCLSSSAPGPSPTNTSLAFALPSPNTILLRVECSLQRVHSPSSCWIFSNESVALWYPSQNRRLPRSHHSQQSGRHLSLAIFCAHSPPHARFLRRIQPPGGCLFYARR